MSNSLEEYDKLVRKNFRRTLSIIESNDIFTLHDKYLGYYTSITYKNSDGISPETMGYFYGSVTNAFSDSAIEQDYVNFKISTYSGDRTLDRMEEEVRGVLKALEVIKQLEKVYNEERVTFRKVHNIFKEKELNKIKTRRVVEEETKKSPTKGDDSIFQYDNISTVKAFNSIFQYYYNRHRDSSTLLNNELKYDNKYIVGGDSAILIKGQSNQAIKLNIHGFDVCTTDGKGVKEIYRRGKDKLYTIKIVYKIFDKDSKKDREILYNVLRYVYDGQKDRKRKQGMVDSVRNRNEK